MYFIYIGLPSSSEKCFECHRWWWRYPIHISQADFLKLIDQQQKRFSQGYMGGWFVGFFLVLVLKNEMMRSCKKNGRKFWNHPSQRAENSHFSTDNSPWRHCCGENVDDLEENLWVSHPEFSAAVLEFRKDRLKSLLLEVYMLPPTCQWPSKMKGNALKYSKCKATNVKDSEMIRNVCSMHVLFLDLFTSFSYRPVYFPECWYLFSQTDSILGFSSLKKWDNFWIL